MNSIILILSLACYTDVNLRIYTESVGNISICEEMQNGCELAAITLRQHSSPEWKSMLVGS